MNGFLKWFFVFMSSMLAGFGQIFKGLWNGIKQIFNIKNYIRIFKTYSADFGALGWILSVLAIIVVVAIFVLIIFMIVLAVRKYIRFRHSIVSNEDLIEEISDLQRQVVKMTKEKDEIMAMKVAQLGVYDNTALAEGETKLAEGEQLPAVFSSNGESTLFMPNESRSRALSMVNQAKLTAISINASTATGIIFIISSLRFFFSSSLSAFSITLRSATLATSIISSSQALSAILSCGFCKRLSRLCIC